MKEWKKLPVTELKRLVKSRSGRMAELDVEIAVLKSLINQKVESGDLGSSAPRKTEEIPKTEEKKAIIGTEKPQDTPKKPEATPIVEEKPNNENLGELDL